MHRPRVTISERGSISSTFTLTMEVEQMRIIKWISVSLLILGRNKQKLVDTLSWHLFSFRIFPPNKWLRYDWKLRSLLGRTNTVLIQILTKAPLCRSRSPKTRMVYYMMEAPTTYKRMTESRFLNFFNYTMTYTHYSDIYHP